MSLGRAAPSKDANLVLAESRTSVSPIFLSLAPGSTEWVQHGEWPASLHWLHSVQSYSYVETRRLLYEASAQGNRWVIKPWKQMHVYLAQGRSRVAGMIHMPCSLVQYHQGLRCWDHFVLVGSMLSSRSSQGSPAAWAPWPLPPFTLSN